MSRHDPAETPVPLRVVAALIVRGGRCLVAQRSAEMSLPLRWEFPGGKIEDGEDAPAALARELAEELGIEVRVGAEVARSRTDPSGTGVGCAIELLLHEVWIEGGHPEPREHAGLRWVGAEELETLEWPAADVPLLPAARARLRDGTPPAPAAQD